MKAWEINTYFSNDFSDLVFADTRSKAKTKVLNGETALDSVLVYDDSPRYTDIRATRLPNLDDMENVSQMNLVEELICMCGWRYEFEPGSKIWEADNFNKAEFEKEWLKNETD